MLFATCLSIFLFLRCGMSVLVTISYGSLKGSQMKTHNGKIINAVPFAAPPVGELRFRKPQPPKPWSGVKDATKYSAACLSNSTVSSSPQKNVNEDCLYQNIFAPSSCTKNSPCAVMFYLHGGGINYDSAVMFNDQSLVNKFGAEGVILVITAFRLGFTALLTFDNDNIVPRNLAVYDMIESLRFVQQEIVHFGGDPARVTLLGHSMGGSLTTAFSFSKTINDQKLFSQAIAMSPELQFPPPYHLQALTAEIIYRAGCSAYPRIFENSDNEVHEAVECMRKKDAMELLKVQREMEEEDQMKQFGFADSLKTKCNAPVVVIFPNCRGILMLLPFFPAENLRELVKDPPPTNMLLGTILKELDRDSEFQNLAAIIGYDNPNELMMKYSKDAADGVLKFNHTLDSQSFFITCYVCGHNMRRAGAKVFLYSFDYPKHPYHTDDLFYLMGIHPFEMDENEKIINKLYPKYFTDFAKHGSPAEYFVPLQENVDNYLSVFVNVTAGEMPKMKYHYEKEVIDYWTKDMANVDQRISELKDKKSHLNRDLPNAKALVRSAVQSVPDEVLPSVKPADYNMLIFFTVSFLITGMLVGVLYGRLTRSNDEYISMP